MLINWLSSETGLRKERLLYFAMTASKRYYIFSIKKRNGDPREIAHPAKPLKSIQRWLNARLIKSLDVHSSATAYHKGASIRSNAVLHSASRFTLRVDLEDFFSSFDREGISKFLRQSECMKMIGSDEDLNFFLDIATRNGSLTIGAPTSPHITNAMMFSFDTKVSNYCESRGLVYSRYADDIFISSYQPGLLSEAYTVVKEVVKDFQFAELKINYKKTTFLSRRYRRSITGLVITPDGKISIGRGRKREIKSLVHRHTVNDLTDISDIERLKGLIAFCYDCDISFYNSLLKKYGSKEISKITSG